MSAATVKKAPLVLARAFTKIPGAQNALIGRTAEGVTASPNEPNLVLICGWMDAQLPHLYKYTEAYNKLYPGATQILLRSQSSDWFTSKDTAAKAAIPVAKVLEEYAASGILLHVFSNGGCWAAGALSDALALTKAAPAPLPVTAVVFDSCPGDSNFASASVAFTAQIRNTAAKYVAKALCYAVFSTMWVLETIAGQRVGPIERVRDRLLDPNVLPHSIPRTYIYSDSDLLVPFTAVEAHAATVKAQGIDVTLEKFSGTPHVNHLKGDPARYWDIVGKAWEQSR